MTDILMSIMSCRGFSKKSTFILTCRSALVPCYLSKRLIIVETEEVNLDHIPIKVKNHINSVDLHDEDSLFTWIFSIPLIFNTLKKDSYHEMIMILMFQLIMMNSILNASNYCLNIVLEDYERN